MKKNAAVLWVISVLAAVSAGILGALLLRPDPTPAEFQQAQELRTVPVSAGTFSDPRTVAVAFMTTPERTVQLGGSGVLTASACTPGGGITSGTVVGRVDELPILALSTSVPLFRDLRTGDEGTDVNALRHELSRLGFEVDPTGSYSSAVTAAVTKLQKQLGFPDPDGSLKRAEIAWIPETTVIAKSCDAIVGEAIDSASVLATIAGGLSNVRVGPGTSTIELMPGERRLTLFGAAGLIDSEGSVSDPDFLQAVVNSSEYKMSLAKSSQEHIQTGSSELVTPVSVYRVSPAAVFGVEGQAGCVQSGGDAVPISIVGSSLGVTSFISERRLTAANIGTAITVEGCS